MRSIPVSHWSACLDDVSTAECDVNSLVVVVGEVVVTVVGSGQTVQTAQISINKCGIDKCSFVQIID